MHIKAKRKESLRALYAAFQKVGAKVEKVSAVLKKKPEKVQAGN